MTFAFPVSVGRRARRAAEYSAVAFARQFEESGTTHFPYAPAAVRAAVRAGVSREVAVEFARRVHEHSHGVCAATPFPGEV